MITENKLVGAGGFIATSDTANGSFYAVYVNADCVFDSFKVGGVEKLVDFGLSGLTVKQGTLLFAAQDTVITTVDVSSGSVICYKN